MHTFAPTSAAPDATIYFDARANQALTHTRAAWVALGELLSGEPVLPGALEQATARYHEALMQLGLQALRTSYLNPPSLALVDLPALEEDDAADEDETEADEAPQAPYPPTLPPTSVQVRRAPSPPAEPARPKKADAPHPARVDAAQLRALKEQLGQPVGWADEAAAPTHAQEAARALDAQVRAVCVAGIKGWRQGQAALVEIAALVREPRQWHVLDSADRVELLSALAAMIRHIDQVPLPSAHHTARCEQLKAILTRVHQARRDSVDGFVHGLGKGQAPRYGGDWWQDARHILGLDAPKCAAKQAAAPCAPQPAVREVEAAPTRVNPYPHVKGQRWALVGGDRRGERGESFCALLELEKLEWIDSAPGKHKHIGNVLKRMKHGSLDAVVVLKQFINHSATDKLVEAGKKHGVAVIWVEGGYGEHQLLAAIQRYYPACV